MPFLTYDNALVWKALGNLGEIFDRLGEGDEAARMRQRATLLKQAILRHSVSAKAPGAGGEIFASATDGTNVVFTEIPPGSLMRMASLGFVAEDDPVFARTYEWLHSKNYPYSYTGQAYGLPGSYRLPITTSWQVADHLRLQRGRELALKILRASPWDGGIITEGMDPATAHMDAPGGAFATAAGYVADALCQVYCQPRP
jgi:meiotically up-regulated gene 157 (Mug157) protein